MKKRYFSKTVPQNPVVMGSRKIQFFSVNPEIGIYIPEKGQKDEEVEAEYKYFEECMEVPKFGISEISEGQFKELEKKTSLLGSSGNRLTLGYRTQTAIGGQQLAKDTLSPVVAEEESTPPPTEPKVESAAAKSEPDKEIEDALEDLKKPSNKPTASTAQPSGGRRGSRRT